MNPAEQKRHTTVRTPDKAANQRFTWRGKDIATLTREELITALREAIIWIQDSLELDAELRQTTQILESRRD